MAIEWIEYEDAYRAYLGNIGRLIVRKRSRGRFSVSLRFESQIDLRPIYSRLKSAKAAAERGARRLVSEAQKELEGSDE